MKILYLHQYFKTPDEPGGTRPYWLSKELIKDGHNVTMITSKDLKGQKNEEEKLGCFVKNEDITRNWYLTKAHFFQTKSLSVKYPEEVCFLLIERDLRDAVVSHYHHFLLYKKIKLNFNIYYKLVGRFKAYEIWLFNWRCRKYLGENSFFKFETMKVNVESTIDKICNILNLSKLSEEEIQMVIKETSLDALRNRAKSGDNTHYHGAGKDNAKLFRKGNIGEYIKYFNKRNLNDVNKILHGKFSPMSKLYYNFVFTLRRKVSI
jgi:hypothetical protein